MNANGMEAGRQRHGDLWSTLEEVCDLLHIRVNMPADCEKSLFQHIVLKTGQRVFHVGQAFDSLYIVRSGFLKTTQFDECGNEQVLSFPMRGDLLGLDGIHGDRYESEAVALSDCDLVVLPFARLTALSQAHRDTVNLLCRILSRELVRRQAIMGMLGTLPAEARVARFLIEMAQRFETLGYSNKTFNLRMTRQEIGSYLGLTLETVSRTLSAFNEIGLIAIHQRSVTIKEPEALKTLRRVVSSQGAAKRAWQEE